MNTMESGNPTRSRKISIHARSQPSYKEGRKKAVETHKINSRQKGSAGEREFSGRINELLGVKLVRKLDQTRGGGHDLELAKDQVGPLADVMATFAIECKRYGIVTDGKIKEWWAQAVEQGSKAGLIPVLAYRENRGSWRVTVPISLLVPTLPMLPEVGMTVEMSVEAFSLVVRELRS